MNDPSPSSGAEERDTPGQNSEFQRLESLAFQRSQQGLALPRELYEAPFRSRLDWSRFPSWTWPADPELYEECGHEG